MLNFGFLDSGEYTLHTSLPLLNEETPSIRVVDSPWTERETQNINLEEQLDFLNHDVAGLRFYAAEDEVWLRLVQALEALHPEQGVLHLFTRNVARDLLNQYDQGAMSYQISTLHRKELVQQEVWKVLSGADEELRAIARLLLVRANAWSESFDRFFAQWSPNRETMYQQVGSEARILTTLRAATSYSPILTELRGYVSELKDASPYSALTLCLALIEAGDFETARGLYDSICQKHMLRRGPWVYLQNRLGDTDYHFFLLTVQACQVAVRLGDAQAERMLNYLLDNLDDSQQGSPKNILRLLDCAMNLRPSWNTASSFVYRFDDVERTVRLDRDVRWLALDATEFADIEFQPLQGEVRLQLLYSEGANMHSTASASESTPVMNRSIKPIAGGTLRVGDIAIVEVDITLPDDWIRQTSLLQEVIPTGMRFIDLMRDAANQLNLKAYHPGQQVRLSFHPWRNQTSHIAYYVRLVAPGTFTFDSGWLRNEETGIWYAGETLTFVIEE